MEATFFPIIIIGVAVIGFVIMKGMFSKAGLIVGAVVIAASLLFAQPVIASAKAEVNNTVQSELSTITNGLDVGSWMK